MISVIIPYYNGRRWLASSVGSVLSQEGVSLEVVVVDDGSEDPAEELAGLFTDSRVRFVAIPHSGKGAAVNRGVEASSGEFICVLDQDDTMAPGRLARQVAALAAEPEVAAVYSDYERVSESGRVLDVFRSRPATNAEMLRAMAASTGLISIQTMTIRRSGFLSLGGFCEDPALTGLDDGEFFARLIASGALLRYVPGVAGRWTSHGGNYSKGAPFQAARLVLLSRLESLCARYPMLRAELGSFKAHNREMRGIFFLDEGKNLEAATELAAAIRARPLALNPYYLLLKALFLACLGRRGRG